MLYHKNILSEDGEKKDFLLDVEPYNEDIDIKEVAAIEGFLKNNGYIPDKYIPTFLNWLVYRVRVAITEPYESALDSSFAGRCAVAQSYYDHLIPKLGLEFFNFNVGDILGTEPVHALTGIVIPTKKDGENIKKTFILDPTFRQFFLSEENRFERYFEEPRWSVRMSTPHPGYFFNLTDKGRNFASNVIKMGYFEATDDNFKTYFDPFVLYVTPKEDYDDSRLIGKMSETSNPGKLYSDLVNGVSSTKFFRSERYNIDTPIESIEKEKSKLKNRIKSFFHKSELDSMFIIEDNSSLDYKTQKRG